MIAQRERLGESGDDLLIHPHLDLLRGADGFSVEDPFVQRLTPHPKEVAERQQTVVTGLDVDDPARVVRV